MTTRLGVIGYELLLLCISSLVLLAPSYFAVRAGYTRVGQAWALVVTLLMLVLIATSWSFYKFFETFIGYYAIQMIVQDGGQLLAFIGKMPSAIDYPSLLVVVVTAALILIAIFSKNRFATAQRTFFSVATVLLLVTSTFTSLSWNNARTYDVTTDPKQHAVMNRVLESEFLSLKRKAGPITELYSSMLNELVVRKSHYSINEKTLREIQPIAAKDESTINKQNIVFILV